MSKIADPNIVAKFLATLGAMLDQLAGWGPDLGFLPIIHEKGFGPVLASVGFYRWQGMVWMCVDLADVLPLYIWGTGRS